MITAIIQIMVTILILKLIIIKELFGTIGVLSLVSRSQR